VLDEGTPIFVQVADQLAAQIAEGQLHEGDRVPSSKELAAFYRVNPATAAKGLKVLIDQGVLEERRGLGLFVGPGVRQRLLEASRHGFAERHVAPMVTEAEHLGIDACALLTLVRQASRPNRGTRP